MLEEYSRSVWTLNYRPRVSINVAIFQHSIRALSHHNCKIFLRDFLNNMGKTLCALRNAIFIISIIPKQLTKILTHHFWIEIQNSCWHLHWCKYLAYTHPTPCDTSKIFIFFSFAFKLFLNEYEAFCPLTNKRGISSYCSWD